MWAWPRAVNQTGAIFLMVGYMVRGDSYNMISRKFYGQGHSHCAEIIQVIGQAKTRILCASMEAVFKERY